MIRFDATALYTRRDLIELLEPLGIDADGFLSRIKPVKRFRLAWFGEDLLNAIRNAPPLDEEKQRPAMETQRHGSRRRGRQAERKMLEPLQKLIQESSR